MSRYHNFSAGPAALPYSVLEEAHNCFLDHGHGASILETSHRSPEFTAVLEHANQTLREVAAIPDTHDILWLQGGASTQFAMVPMNFLTPGKCGAYVVTGTWSEKAFEEAEILGDAHTVATSVDSGFNHIPAEDTWNIPANAAYVHTTSNNTIYGTQFAGIPNVGAVPLVCDMSSDILCRPTDFAKFDLVYAGAQKNLGPSGVTLVIVRKDWLKDARTDIPTMLRYKVHSDKGSTYNTPPVYPIYLVGRMVQWLKDNGGLAAMAETNDRKAGRLYGLLDSQPDFFKGHAAKDSRSVMNVTFNLPTEDLEKQFVAEAKAANLVGLKGHRSVGGIRASIYNAVPEASVEALAQFMEAFSQKHA